MNRPIALFAAIAGLQAVASYSIAESIPAAATTALNVRQGPGTSFDAVDRLRGGEEVTIVECNEEEWCRIDRSGPTGWVSAEYLAPISNSFGIEGGQGTTCHFSFNDLSQRRLKIECGQPTIQLNEPLPEPVAEAEGDSACFYPDPGYRGEETCYEVAQLPILPEGLNNKISSISLNGDAKVWLCSEQELKGYCRPIFGDMPELDSLTDNKVSSLAIYTDIPPRPNNQIGPSGKGEVVLRRHSYADLDTQSASDSEVDLHFRVGSPTEQEIVPVNGASLALGDGSNRGRFGCQSETFTTDPINLWSIPVGTYFCVTSSDERITLVRVAGYNGRELKLEYSSWAE